MAAELHVSLEGVSKYFDGGATVGVEGIDLRLERGRFYALSGPSGCGKSTLLHLIAMMERPDSGVLRFGHQPYSAIKDTARFLREEIGFVFQFHHLIPILTLKENVECALIGDPRLSASMRSARAEQLLEQVGLAHRINTPAMRVSGGERQRAALARALANKPALLIADEPTGNVDSATAQMLLELLYGYVKAEGATLLLCTHDERLSQAAQIRITLRDGKIETIKEQYASYM